MFFVDLEKQLLDVNDAGVFFVDRLRMIIYWNKEAERLTGFQDSAVTGRRCWDDLLCHVDEEGQSLCGMSCPLRATIRDGIHREARVYLRHLDGHRQPVYVWTGPRYNENGEVVGAIQLFTDATEPRRAALRLDHEDPLTGLGGRPYLREQLNEKLYDLFRYDRPFGVLVADIDRLRQEVNHAYCKSVGNELIAMVARTLSRALQRSDVIARSDDDEFVIMLPGTTDAELSEVAERLRRLVSVSRLPSLPYRSEVTISLGGTLAASTDQPDVLLARARANLEEAKQAGRDRVVISSHQIRSDSNPTRARITIASTAMMSTAQIGW